MFGELVGLWCPGLFHTPCYFEQILPPVLMKNNINRESIVIVEPEKYLSKSCNNFGMEPIIYFV